MVARDCIFSTNSHLCLYVLYCIRNKQGMTNGTSEKLSPSSFEL